MSRFKGAVLRGAAATGFSLTFAMLVPVDARATTNTFLSMSSDAGDYIGQGQTYLYTVADGPWTADKNYDNGVSIAFHAPTYDHFWYLDFAAPQSVLLTPGVYAGATRSTSSWT